MFLDLLLEIQERIVSYCSVAALNNLACTCTTYKEAVKPFIYKAVRIPLSNSPDFLENNKAILGDVVKYTRVLKLSPKDCQNEGTLMRIPDHVFSFVGKLTHLLELELCCSKTNDDDLAIVTSSSKRLKVMNLANTDIRDLNDCITELNEIERLILHPSNMTDVALSRVSSLCSLKRLEVDGRALTDDGFVDIWRLSRLETLFIRGCDNITDVSLFHIAMLQNLRKLHLRGTGINDKGLKHMTALPKLKTLALWSCTNMSDQGFQHVCSMKTLENLEVGFCRGFSDEGFSRIRTLNGLKEISINGCYRLSDKACSNISMLHTVKKVDISGCRHITDMGIQMLSSLPCLEELTMSGCNQITSLGFSYICAIRSLCRLDIEQCWINEMSLLHIMNYLPKLKWINISYCHGVSDKSVENYRKCKPNIDIIVIS